MFLLNIVCHYFSSISAATTTVSTPATCSSQTVVSTIDLIERFLIVLLSSELYTYTYC